MEFYINQLIEWVFFSESLDDLEKMVRESFSKIPNKWVKLFLLQNIDSL